MDKLRELIEKMLAEGKELPEISKAVMAMKQEDAEVAAATTGETPEEVDTEEVVDETEKIIKQIEAAKVAQARVSKKTKDTELKGIIKEAVKEELKSMPAKKEEIKSDVKFFDFCTGKYVESKGLTPGQEALCDLMGALSRRDVASAKSIDKEIAQDWAQKAERMGVPQMKTPLYSDATTGSYLIPAEVAVDIMKLAYERSVMAELLNRQVVTYESKLFPIMYGGDFAWLADQTSQIADKTPVISNPTVTMERFGGIYLSSNLLLQMKGEALVSAFVAQAGSKVAEFTDKYTTVGSIDGSGSDKLDGIFFNAATSFLTDVAFASISQDDFTNLIKQLSGKVPTNRMVFLANRKVRLAYGNVADSSGSPIFKNFAETGQFQPYGIPFVENTQIPSTIDMATDEPLTGSNDIIGCIDPTMILFAMDNLRIDTSEHFKFDYDQYAWRILARTGLQIASATGTAGIVASAIELTN